MSDDVLATQPSMATDLSDACAAQVGGLGMAAGGNIGDDYAVFEATHGTAPSTPARMSSIHRASSCPAPDFFPHMGWKEVSQLIERGITGKP